MNFFAITSTIFSRSNAPPPPLTRARAGSTSSAPSIATSNSDFSFNVHNGMFNDSACSRARSLRRDANHILELTARELLAHALDREVRRGSGTETDDHAGLDVIVDGLVPHELLELILGERHDSRRRSRSGRAPGRAERRATGGVGENGGARVRGGAEAEHRRAGRASRCGGRSSRTRGPYPTPERVGAGGARAARWPRTIETMIPRRRLARRAALARRGRVDERRDRRGS